MTTKDARRAQNGQLHAQSEHDIDLIPPQSEDLPLPEATIAEGTSDEANRPAPEILLPGMVLLRRYLSPSQQQELVNEANILGKGQGGFYKPTYASGAKCRLHQMCVGRHWNVVSETYESVRTNFDNATVPPLPESWIKLAVESCQVATSIDSNVMGTCDALVPDVCVVNYYKKAGRNGLHIDKDESNRALEMGSPVVSFSIGCTGDFAYADHYPEGKEPVPVVKLESGDVLVFGGPARKVVHSLTRVYGNTMPSWLRMKPGRLNFTFREYEPKKMTSGGQKPM